MSTSNGTGSHAAVTDARPVTLVRYRPGVVGETARTVHLVPLPVGGPAGAVAALCGTPLRREDVEPVTPGQGMPCSVCVLSRVAGGPPPPPVTTGDTRVDTDPLAATAGYRAWGWPVILRRDQIRLNLDGDTVALIIPVLLAAEVTAILAMRRCPVPVLAHPYAPEHRILLVAEHFRGGAALATGRTRGHRNPAALTHRDSPRPDHLDTAT